jgi:hypothetical protein
VDATWIVAGDADAVAPFARDARWERLASPPGTRAWTDDFADVFGAVRWR